MLLTGIQRLCLGKSCKGLVLFRNGAFGCGYIELHHFLTGIGITDVGNIRGDGHDASIDADRSILDCKIRIAQTKTKGIGRLYTEGFDGG